MGRHRKRQHKQPSVIGSDVDQRFSPAFEESDSSTDSNDSPSDTSIPASPVVVPQKRQKTPKKTSSTNATAIPEPIQTSTKINYIIQAFSASEMKKPASKRSAKNSSLQLSPDEPWDTLQAQFLAQIDTLLKPKTHVYTDYQIMFTIPRIVAKPGIALISANDYTLLLERARKSNLVHINIMALKDDSDKENDALEEPAPKSTKKASRDPRTLPGNVRQIANIKALQEHWRCPKKTPTCLSFYCYIDDDGTHIPLGNEQLECWASAMVCTVHSFVYFTSTNNPFSSIDERRRARNITEAPQSSSF
jgi:hypothetical protein